VVDEKALVEALRQKKIAGAGLDVYENEPALTPGLTELDNEVLLPHVGSATVDVRIRMAEMAAENPLSALRGEVPPNLLKPEALMSRRSCSYGEDRTDHGGSVFSFRCGRRARRSCFRSKGVIKYKVNDQPIR
jgi:D-isomer specific 2-hydroxyacid dehydrogenase, NAD binding domain